MPPYIYVLGTALTERVFSQGHSPLVVLVNNDIVLHRALFYRTITIGRRRDRTALTNMHSLAPSAIATYSSSVVDKAAQCCVRLMHDTATPQNITAIPETDRVSVSFWQRKHHNIFTESTLSSELNVKQYILILVRYAETF